MFTNYDNTSMFPVNMYCVLSVNARVARAASGVYCLKMVQIKQTLYNMLCRDCLCVHKLNSKIRGIS